MRWKFGFGARQLNHAGENRASGGDIWRAMRLQNLCLFVLIFVLFTGGSAIFVALLIKPVPVLLVDREGRFIGQIEYSGQRPLTEAQLESVSKLFVQYYLSQNSATVYADAEVALASMCANLRHQTQKNWIENGRLAEIIQRVQISRVIFTDFETLKRLNSEDIQVSLKGKILIDSDARLDGSISDAAKDFHLRLAMRQVAISEHNYLGIEVCSVRFL